MSSNKTTVTIKHADGSTLQVQVSNITDPKLKVEVEQLLANKHIKVNGTIIKKQ